MENVRASTGRVDRKTGSRSGSWLMELFAEMTPNQSGQTNQAAAEQHEHARFWNN